MIRLGDFLARLRRDQRGLAMLEFGFTLPIILIIILFGVEAANMGISWMRIHQIAATSADNAARVRDSIDELDVNEVLLGGKIIGERMDFANRGRIVLSDVTSNGQSGNRAGLTILWQRCTGALNNSDSQPKYGTQGAGASNNSLQAMGTSPRQIAPTNGSPLIFAEVTYRYKPIIDAPIFGSIFGQPILRSEAAFTVRERASETLDDGPNGTTDSVCTRYDL
jgi:Flp pilus assembly protein TadG